MACGGCTSHRFQQFALNLWRLCAKYCVIGPDRTMQHRLRCSTGYFSGTAAPSHPVDRIRLNRRGIRAAPGRKTRQSRSCPARSLETCRKITRVDHQELGSMFGYNSNSKDVKEQVTNVWIPDVISSMEFNSF